MVLYTCEMGRSFGNVPAPVAHPCGRAARALDQAGHDYEHRTVKGGTFKIWTWPSRAPDRREIEPAIEEGERIFLALDVGGAESATALVWISESLQVGCWIDYGDEAIFGALDRIRELREEFVVIELCADPWRAKQAMMELEREGLRCVELPQTDVRICPASQRLRQAIVDRRLTLPDDAELTRHAANAVQRHVRRGWRLEKPDRSSPIDGIISLAMALDRIEQRPEPVRLVGWV